MKRKIQRLDEKASSEKSRLNRRTFVKMFPAAGAAGLALPARLGATIAGARDFEPQERRSPQPERISKEALHTAEALIGIELTDAQESMALSGVNRNLSTYEALRKIDVPLDTEPATAFHPAPGAMLQRARKRNRTNRRSASSHGAVGSSRVPKYNSLEEVAFFTVSQLAELVRTRKVSSVDLTKMYLARLNRYSPKLICLVTLTEDLALEQARKADLEIRRGKYRGPLHGIPWGAKDLFSTKGIRTTWGAEPFRDQVIDYDATVVERLREAGAVLVAKLSMGALAQGAKWFAGVTRNPWQVEESVFGSSGSSAGPASATAAGLVGFSIGTETLGSIVSPSSRCGLVGLRPTYGRVSRYGAMGLSWTMDKIGPICRGVEDCALALAAIYGPDGRDVTVEDVPFSFEPDLRIDKMRVGYIKAEFETGNDAQKAMYKEALDALKGAGADLQPVELPKFAANNLLIILNAEAGAAFDDITRNGAINQLSGQAPNDWPNSFRTSRFIPAVEYIRAQRARVLLMREMDKFMSEWDVVVSPAPRSSSLLITNLTGQPQVCVPCGFVQDLPRSIMFTGNLYDEASPLRVALAFERATKWHTMHPKVDWA
jgi:Asp-tRNA(Asn)/Glu-tRNA(Gln) amidotransferase A subunit family amidase